MTIGGFATEVVRVAQEVENRQIFRDAQVAAQRAHANLAKQDTTAGEDIHKDLPPSTRFCPCSYCQGQRDILNHRLPPVLSRHVVVEEACKAFAKNQISGNEFEKRVKLVTDDNVVIDPDSRGQADKDRAATRLDLVPDSLDPRDKCLSNWNGKPVQVWAAPGKTEDITRAAPEILSAARPGIGGAPTRATTLPAGAAERKKYPVASGFMDYFPDAIGAISHLSWQGNEQHNPGEPLHWARGKSTDEADTMLRHFLQRGTNDGDGIPHSVKMAWRALALLQKELELVRTT